MTGLLILGCSQRKRGFSQEWLPAIERYDGPLVRVVRKWRAWPAERQQLDVYFISARHGLISGDLKIGTYDQEMTPARATELRPVVQLDVRDLVQASPYGQIAVTMGGLYLHVLGDVFKANGLPAVAFFGGGIGQRAQALKAWLHGLEIPV